MIWTAATSVGEWSSWQTVTAATSSKKGVGKRTRTIQGTETNKKTNATRPATKIEEETQSIPVGKVLNTDGTFSNMPQTETTLPAWTSIPNVNVLAEIDGGIVEF